MVLRLSLALMCLGLLKFVPVLLWVSSDDASRQGDGGYYPRRHRALVPVAGVEGAPALKPLAPGAVLEVLATDPGATKDFEHFCATTGCELLEASEQPGGVLRFRMRKPG